MLLFACFHYNYIRCQDVVYVVSGPWLYEFDPISCDTTYIGDTGIGFGDIALTPEGRLFGISSSYLYEIDRTTGMPELVTTIPAPFSGVSLVALDNEQLLFESWDSLCVIRTDGSFAVLGYIGYSASGDLTWYQGDLYMTAGYDALIRIRMSESQSGIIGVDSIGVMEMPFYGVLGAVTIRTGPCVDDIRLIAFNGNDVYFVEPSNAQVQPQCIGAFQYGVSGAATSAELNELTANPPAVVVNVFTPNGDGVNDQFAPMQSGSLYYLQVYSRWGDLMHSATTSWDGRSSGGEPAPDGVYYYVLQSSSECSGQEKLKGHVSLLR
ncbi:MAG: gliding motility-associated C-terminal domain-containing protein [Flavobacteriales bacterium]|nr:gliding motility-associated C-terminal domain-containing protein [Flavobacteriales bacterium]MBK6945125.1 gliding motility-associated C-terminal domain-containing protein [Flavobacteriales bacterium]MBK7239474.1 gliding motility-associated C-terminal domain-containing protein [Flavobacteriales bacterium]MBK7296019.1 gliding motility-associated C-terminal domain-containing protein [Flavobacteriales bacterium]MBK9535320.1 gliding motility-associated C-terminal domain-containing protein [Flavob